jgi:signal peptidase I
MTVVDPSVSAGSPGGGVQSTPSPGASDTAAAPPSWWLLTGATVSRALLAFLVGLLLWSVVPAVFGWTSHVVLSGSMEPRIDAGDVVLSSGADLGGVIPGQVVAFDDPNVPGRTLVHRVTAVGPDGLTTRGDANPTADSHPVDSAHLQGLARLRVRLAGLPVLWFHDRAWLPLGLFIALLAAALSLVRRDNAAERAWAAAQLAPAEDVLDLQDITAASPEPVVDLHDPEPPAAAEGREPAIDLHDREPAIDLRRRISRPVLASDPTTANDVDPSRWRRSPGAGGTMFVVLLGLAIAVTLVVGTAHAAFAATTTNARDQWALSPNAQFGTGTYVSAVLADSPLFFYRLGESGGGTAADVSPNARNGTYGGSWNYRVAGAPLPRTSGLGAGTTSSSCLSTPLQIGSPQTYSYEVWFRTTSTAGGKLVSFEKSQTGTSAQYDRHVYMTADGSLVFGVWTGGPTTISSGPGWNDGLWHQAAATMGSAGMRLYVDGTLVASGTNPVSENYNGWWRAACGSLGLWPNYPTDPAGTTFQGDLADWSVYSSQLSATAVRTHFYAA